MATDPLVLHAGVIGAGRVGAEVVRQLLSLPFKKISVADCDVVSATDRGSVYPAAEHERMKARAAAKLIESFDPRITASSVIMKIDQDSIPRFRDFVESVDLLFWCIDDWRALRLVMSIIYPIVRCVAVALSQQDGYIEAAWSMPFQTPCLACSMDAAHKETAHGTASLSLDVVAAANLAVRLGVGLSLIGHRGQELFDSHLDPAHTLLISQTRNNAFTISSNPLVPAMTQLLRTDTLSCEVCRSRFSLR